MTWQLIPRERFEWIEEWHAQEERKYLVGVIAFQRIKRKYTGGKKIILRLYFTPEPIIEDMETRKLKKRSLELAGVI